MSERKRKDFFFKCCPGSTKQETRVYRRGCFNFFCLIDSLYIIMILLLHCLRKQKKIPKSDFDGFAFFLVIANRCKDISKEAKFYNFLIHRFLGIKGVNVRANYFPLIFSTKGTDTSCATQSQRDINIIATHGALQDLNLEFIVSSVW